MFWDLRDHHIKDSVKSLAPWEGLVALLGDNLTGDVHEGAEVVITGESAIYWVHPDAGLHPEETTFTSSQSA